ncbi:MAG: HAMP domain-containing histidine kinase [Sedimentisphaerales bacterium]|nr:HAMP domain-containing histidine kinase [Sedimentisphaerales bacterium]
MFGNRRRPINTGSGQLWWVILLLAIAVILPTVCLLWFMTQAVDNVRMAARQILINEYSERVSGLADAVNKVWVKRAEAVEAQADANAIGQFASFILDEPVAEGALVYDESGNLAYPIIDVNWVEPRLPEEFEKAWELEFVQREYTEAAHIYGDLEKSAGDDYLRRKAELGQARCYRNRDIGMASIFCEQAGYSVITPEISAGSVSLAAKARVMLAEVFKDEPLRLLAWGRLIDTANNYEPGPRSPNFLPMDSGTRMFVQQRAIQLVETSSLPDASAYLSKIAKTKKLLAAERLSAEVAQRHAADASFRQWSRKSVHRLGISNDLYGSYHQTAGRAFLLLWSGPTVRSDFCNFETRFAGSDVLYRVLDDKGLYVSGYEQPAAREFLTVPVGGSLPGWEVELYFKDADIFDKVARRQVTIYIWAGALVIALILAVGGFAGRVVGGQMKVNRLKNDFIATVTHELKTPLASMRVLADTLLEGNYKDRQQATEYLELICKENKRLTGLIDNFLTFSRMERNKQAFEFEPTSPAEIARAAADAVRTKFEKAQCELTLDVADDLPEVFADADAMTTVLINLLDNACKYSRGEKKIALRVFAAGDSVGFSVRDNGIGISRRDIKKIFKRFYQVDRTLSRRVEGAGLGLSIVEFIVDAHNGQIAVESQPGRGSTFTVRLPTAR